MKTGTKIGWALVAVSIIISVWVLSGGIGRAEDPPHDTQGNKFNITGSTLNGLLEFGGNPVTIPDDVDTIGANAFAGNTKIEEVEATNVKIVDPQAFMGCTSLKRVALDNTVSIGAKAFYGCSKLSSVDVGALVSIDSLAFAGCTNMGAVNLPSGVSTIAGDAFDGCTSLSKIQVVDDNPYFSTDGIALYSKDGTELKKVPPAANAGGSTYTIRTGCTSVAANAFNGCMNINVLKIPSTVGKWGTQGGWYPAFIELETYDISSDIYLALKSEFFGKSIIGPYGTAANGGGGGGGGGDDPNPPVGGYSITNIVPNADGTVTIFFSAPGASSGTAGGIALDNGVNCSVAPNGTGCTVTLTKALVDSLRPASGTKSIPVSLTYTNTSTGQQYPASSAFILSASGSVDPGPVVTTYTIMPEYREMYNTDGSFVMETNAPYSAIQSVTLSNNGNQDLSGYYTIENLGTGSRITISSNYIRGLTPGGQYTFKVNFNDGKAAVYSKLKIKTTSSGGSTSGGTTGGSTYRPSTSGGTYTSGTGTVSNLYGNGTGTTYGGGYTTTASSATGTSHLKDTTPSTADGWDARLAFAIAVLLAGVVVLMLSRRNAAKLETIRRDREGQEH